MSLRAEPAVLWHEGMFLCPQHMQAFARELQARIAQGGAVGTPGWYGLLSLKIESAKLEHDVFSILEGTVVFRDGVLGRIPETASVEQRAFGPLFTGTELEVWLGVPAPRPNVPQTDHGSDGRPTRYRVTTEPVFDENLRDSVKDLEFRQLQARLFFGDEDRTGFECLPIALLVRRGRTEARSALSSEYVPPLLACGAAPELSAALKEIADLLRGQARDLAVRLPPTAALSSIDKGADLAGFVKLEALNRSLPVIDQLAATPAAHPWDAYLALVQVVGNLAVFGPERTVPNLPAYDHERLGECFSAALSAIRALIAVEVAMRYDTVSFHKDPVREGFLECEIPREWIGAQPICYFAIELGEPPEEVVELVRVGVKLVAERDIERVLQGVVPGIRLDHERTPPLAFPRRPGLHYFRIHTEGPSREPWLHVLESRKAVLLSTLGAIGEVQYHLFVELRR